MNGKSNIENRNHHRNAIGFLAREKLDLQSQAEYDAVLPHLVGIVKENFSDSLEPIVQITAAGYGYAVTVTACIAVS